MKFLNHHNRNKRLRLEDFQVQSKKRKIELEEKKKNATREINERIDHLINSLDGKKLQIRFFKLFLNHYDDISERRLHFHDKVNRAFHKKLLEIETQQETVSRLIRAIDHAEQFVNFVQSRNEMEALLNSKRLSSNYFQLILREPSPSRESLRRLNLDVRNEFLIRVYNDSR